MSVGAAEAALADSHAGQAFDVADLVEVMSAHGLVESIDAVPVSAAPGRAGHGTTLNRIAPERVRWIRHPYLVYAVVVLAISSIALAVHDPDSRPRWSDTTHPDVHPLLSVLAFTVLGLLTATLHELGHFLVARSYGVEATTRWSTRLVFIVFVTDVTGAATRPKRQRVAILLGGVAVNFLLGGAAFLTAVAAQEGIMALSPLTVHGLRLFAYVNWLPIAFQFFLFARTDLYHILAAALDQPRLGPDSAQYFRWRVKRLFRGRRPSQVSPCPSCTARVVRGDPFCLKCGVQLPVRDPNKLPFRFRDRNKLALGGLLLVVMAVPGYIFLVRLVARIGTSYLPAARRMLGDALLARDVLGLTTAVVLLGILFINIGVVLWSARKRLWRLVRGAWAGTRYLTTALRKARRERALR